jgi:rubrerythrin
LQWKKKNTARITIANWPPKQTIRDFRKYLACWPTDVLSDAKSIFEQVKQAADKFSFEASQVETYKKAQDIEKESREFYLQKADEVQDHCQKGIFRKLAEEENKHYFLLDNIIDFVSRPEQWLENAEFHHLEDY